MASFSITGLALFSLSECTSTRFGGWPDALRSLVMYVSSRLLSSLESSLRSSSSSAVFVSLSQSGSVNELSWSVFVCVVALYLLEPLMLPSYSAMAFLTLTNPLAVELAD